jgi:hypothetical protein
VDKLATIGQHEVSADAVVLVSPVRSALMLASTTAKLQQSFGLSLEQHAFMFWASSYAFRHDDLSEPGHDYNIHVLEYWSRAQPGSPLHFGLAAVSHAVLKSVTGRGCNGLWLRMCFELIKSSSVVS